MYPLLRKPANKPKGYLELGIPNHPSDEARNYIKGVWTTDRALAATSFEIKNTTSNYIRPNCCVNKTIIETALLKDQAKTVLLALEEKRKDFDPPTNGEIVGWSCTGDLSEHCNGNQLFLCWQWKATEIGKVLYAVIAVCNTITSHKTCIIVSFYNITDIARMFRQKEHHQGSR